MTGKSRSRTRSAPFGRSCSAIAGGPNREPGAGDELLGEFLFRDLTTPLGRAADTSGPPPQCRRTRRRSCCARPSACSASPGRGGSLLQGPPGCLAPATGAALDDQGSKPIEETIQAWIKEEWTSKELGADAMIARLQERLRTRPGTGARNRLLRPRRSVHPQGLAEPAARSEGRHRGGQQAGAAGGPAFALDRAQPARRPWRKPSARRPRPCSSNGRRSWPGSRCPWSSSRTSGWPAPRKPFASSSR